jgi:hypothetical protein
MSLTVLHSLTQPHSETDPASQTYTPLKGCKCEGQAVRVMRRERIYDASYLSDNLGNTHENEYIVWTSIVPIIVNIGSYFITR